MQKANRLLSVVNGIIGHAFEEVKSPLAIEMALIYEKQVISVTKSSLSKANLPKSDKICIFTHGSCALETSWQFKNKSPNNYGLLLQKEMGHTPFFVRYNSGLHISTNGKKISEMLEKLVERYPHPPSEIVLIGHSMGGLIYRSACYYGELKKMKWVKLVKKIFYLGSPHLGTHFEKFGKLTTTILEQIPNVYTKALAGLIDLRSDGIKDMRHGFLTEDEWKNKDAGKLFYLHKNKTPLLKQANHYLICSTLSKNSKSKIARFFGDGLVHPASGTGNGFSPHCKVFAGMTHNDLQRDLKVYRQIKKWCL